MFHDFGQSLTTFSYPDQTYLALYICEAITHRQETLRDLSKPCTSQLITSFSNLSQRLEVLSVVQTSQPWAQMTTYL